MQHALVFDIDNTLTPPRKPIESQMANILKSLRVPFYLAAGSDLPLIQDQLFIPLHRFGFRGEFDAFLCNGATRFHCQFSDSITTDKVRDFSIENHIGSEAFATMVNTLEQMLDSDEFALQAPVQVIGNRMVNRGSMLNVVPIGRPDGPVGDEAYQNRLRFEAFDKESAYRNKFMARINQQLHDIIQSKDLVVSLGGQTSFDIVARGNDKSFAVVSLLEKGYQHITYIGDALFPGGNDEAILQYIDAWSESTPCPVEALSVECWEQTVEHLQRLDLINNA